MPVKIAIQYCRVDTDQHFEYLGDISIGDVNSDKLNIHSKKFNIDWHKC